MSPAMREVKRSANVYTHAPQPRPFRRRSAQLPLSAAKANKIAHPAVGAASVASTRPPAGPARFVADRDHVGSRQCPYGRLRMARLSRLPLR